MPGKSRATDKHFKAKVRAAGSEALAKLVIDLSDLGEQNRAFVEARLALTEDPLGPYKQRIDGALYPDAFSREPIRIADARKAITEYRRAAGDPHGLLELMMYFVERGTACTVDYGDIGEGFYSSLQSMYDRLLSALEKTDPATKDGFRERARAVVDRARGIGWGYYDYLADRFGEAYPDSDGPNAQ